MPRRVYDPGDRRTKHRTPAVDEPTFVHKDGALVGICPRGMTERERQELLEDAIEAPRTGRRIIVFNVHKGIVYMAESSDGTRFHGYPWRQRPGRQPIPRTILAKLETRATASGHQSEFKTWMKEYGR